MDRVVSKHLFINYQLTGVVDPEVKAMNEAAKEAISSADPEFKAAMELQNSLSPDVDYKIVADFMRKLMAMQFSQPNPAFKESVDNCVHTEFKVPLCHDNDFEVPVLVHTPSSLVKVKSNAAMIYAHGGGCVAGEAIMFKGILSHIAHESGIVIFNVDYRLAPETKCPKNALDFYCAVKHIHENAECFGIDSSRIAIAGASGGGYICFATMVMLAENNEGNLVKLAIPSIPMISDYCFSDVTAMTIEEREAAPFNRKVWRCIANDLETQCSDPLLFPAKASDEIIKKMPPTIIWENEFDVFITEATRMAHRMRSAGRLLEFRIQPGMTHASAIIPGLKGFTDNMRDYKLALKEYLL